MYQYPYMPDPPQNPGAVAVVAGSPAFPSIRGTVRLTQTPAGVHVRADIAGLPLTRTGFFAFHLHSGDCGRPTPLPAAAPGAQMPPDTYFPRADGHFNPGGQPHPMHAGDFPPLLETSRGTAQLAFVTDRLTVFQAIGHAVIIHLNPDDFTTQPSGNAGQLIACGMVVPERAQ